MPIKPWLQLNYKHVKHVEVELDLTILRWSRPAPHQPAAGSSCSWAACCLCSSLSPTCATHTAPRWPNTADTFLCDSAGLRSADSGKQPYTAEGTNRAERHMESFMNIYTGARRLRCWTQNKSDWTAEKTDFNNISTQYQVWRYWFVYRSQCGERDDSFFKGFLLFFF